MPMYTAPHSNLEWYPGSMSHGLCDLAKTGKNILPADLYQGLVDAAGRVYMHEARVNELRAATPAGAPFHSDPFYVYTGYRNALSDLMQKIALPLNQHDGLRFRICTQLSVLLHDVLVVLRAQGIDNHRWFKNRQLAILLAEFESATRLR
ncbi:hypothetical protein BDV93DRAFT_508220 [Ceratobasidium sp. AG-I]|nr:hypothetical protein BDV93DRAFT_508220 [Ceratobasidium sp. AG-I]